MKHSGTCPKCSSTDVHRALHSGANSIRPVESGSGFEVYTTYYICRSCGYVEEWVKPEELPLLQRNFPQK